MRVSYRIAGLVPVALLASCATPLSEELAGKPIPVRATQQSGEGVEIVFSDDKRYESKNGVPRKGDPLVCTKGSVARVNATNDGPNRVRVKAQEEIAVTSVISWTNSGFRQVCGPFVSFVPEAGATYVVVNERIGGKGVSALWTGMARQTCTVSVYRETDSGFTPVPTRKISPGECRVPEV